MSKPARFTAEQLAFRAGVPLRTVRYYVAEKLIDAPEGRGRGSHFTERHLAQLQQARMLHNNGFTLEAIRDRAPELMKHLHKMQEYWPSWPPRAKQSPEPARPEGDPDIDGFLRIPMADGVDLLIDENRALPSPKQLVELALHVRKIFGEL
jgi:DNA-binding transcriptional MerR regulator